ncbi:MAG: hypothetical protein EBV32_02075 [Proteobacteria bacterium]|uniref:Uncharacterized protein n=1 Tax=Candidatus Fonsibacter lacus TaxID=2576439 RepID=A0A964UY08_9PROT|nr:hypothetical protein [Candidatus Fonsibacter lacus]NBP59673.1 hypothetical protein [Pseudomonadota bacterium]NCU71853.1 hypothetical protein [Candidatus Fonsibacter lacus]
MNIKEIELDAFREKINNSKLDYPKSDNKNLFELFFNYMGVASRGGGKTYNTIKIIKEYEKNKMISAQGEHKIRTILISPTYDANKSLWSNLKSLNENDIYESYSEAKLRDIIDDINDVINEVDIYNKYVYYYDLIDKTPKNEIEKVLKSNPEISFILKKFNYENPVKVKRYFRYTTKPITFLILDDIMGSSALNRKSENLLKYWLIKNRHIFTSFFILVQSVKSIPKDMRLNCNLFYLGKFSNKKAILNDLYEEVSSVMTEKEFEALYDKAVNDNNHGALIIDLTGSKKRFYNNLEKELII